MSRYAAPPYRVGVDLPTAVVRFEGVNVSSQVSVGSRSLPTLPNSVLNFCEVGPLLPYLFIERKTHFLHMELSVRCQATYMALQIALCALVSCY